VISGKYFLWLIAGVDRAVVIARHRERGMTSRFPPAYYLQTLIEIGAAKNTTIMFPRPLDLLKGLGVKRPSADPGGE